MRDAPGHSSTSKLRCEVVEWCCVVWCGVVGWGLVVCCVVMCCVVLCCVVFRPIVSYGVLVSCVSCGTRVPLFNHEGFQCLTMEDLETDDTTCTEPDEDTDAETGPDNADVDFDDWTFDLETDPAKLFASASLLLTV